MWLLHKHYYKIVLVYVEHTYEFIDYETRVSPHAITFSKDTLSELTEYTIQSQIHLMCGMCGHVKTDKRTGDWSHLVGHPSWLEKESE